MCGAMIHGELLRPQRVDSYVVELRRMGMDDIWELARAFWFGGTDVYEQRLGPEALMVFPAPASWRLVLHQ